MAAFRLLLNLTLAIALAIVCPFRCQAEAARMLGDEAAVETAHCPCCPHSPAETPEAPSSDDCSDCICHGAVDGPRVAVVECSAPPPSELMAAVADVALPVVGSPTLRQARPDAPDGATLRLLFASLVI